jgi:hypothetical protein
MGRTGMPAGIPGRGLVRGRTPGVFPKSLLISSPIDRGFRDDFCSIAPTPPESPLNGPDDAEASGRIRMAMSLIFVCPGVFGERRLLIQTTFLLLRLPAVSRARSGAASIPGDQFQHDSVQRPWSGAVSENGFSADLGGRHRPVPRTPDSTMNPIQLLNRARHSCRALRLFCMK